MEKNPINWKKSESTVCPDTMQINNGMAYIRRNITSEERQSIYNDSTTKFYVYEEALVEIPVAVKYVNDMVEEQNEQMQSSIDYLVIMTDTEI